MNYKELREYLKQEPYCFRTMKEREEEMNLKIMRHEGKKINFAEASKRTHPEYE